MNDIGALLEFFDNSGRAEDIKITLPCVNNLVKEIDNCFLHLDKKIMFYLISPDLFELIKYYINYYKEILYHFNDGRRLFLPGTYHESEVIVDSSLTNHNYGWLILSKNRMMPSYTKHKFILS